MTAYFTEDIADDILGVALIAAAEAETQYRRDEVYDGELVGLQCSVGDDEEQRVLGETRDKLLTRVIDVDMVGLGTLQLARAFVLNLEEEGGLLPIGIESRWGRSAPRSWPWSPSHSGERRDPEPTGLYCRSAC